MRRKIPNEELGRMDVESYQKSEKIRVTVVLDNVRSLNNIGSIFRTADGFRIEKVVLCGISSTPPHRDIHKTALGAEQSVPWEYFDDTENALEELKQKGYYIISVEQVENSTLLGEIDLEQKIPLALVFGHEIKGVSQKIVNLSDECLEIPQYGTKHSFNISISAGIVLWEVCRVLGDKPY